MLERGQMASAERSIRIVEHRLDADVRKLREELIELRTAQRQAESQARREAFASDIRNNTRWMLAALVAFTATIIFAVVVAL